MTKQKFYKLLMLSSLVSSCLGITSFSNQAFADNMQAKMLDNFQFIANTFDSVYAPAQWKQQFANWSVQDQTEQARAKILNNNNLTLNEYQHILKDFFYSTKDYHVGFGFYSTESAKLDFSIKRAENRFFIVHINRDNLSEDEFPFDIGDEVVAFNGKPIIEVANEIQNQLGNNVKETDEALADARLTSRRSIKLLKVPHGPVTITVKPKSHEQLVSRQLIWDYKPDMVKNNFTSFFNRKYNLNYNHQFNIFDKQMSVDFDLDQSSGYAESDNPYNLGNRDSYLPALGSKIWQSNIDDFFQAYIYKHNNNKLIGYIRIPEYYSGAFSAKIKEFAKIIKKFEATTDALVIDQLNNPGGSVFYSYALMSILSDKPLKTPRHKMSLTQADVVDALDILDVTSDIKTDDDAKEVFGDDYAGYPVGKQFAIFARNYAQFIIDEWNQGKTLTSPYHIFGVDYINPYPKAHYSKPIIILTNSLDFSGGDFFPTTMQDNKRAKIMGTRTAGAGGYVIDINYPNIFGLEKFRYTGSIAERLDKNPIENLGVTPDVKLEVTANDLQNNYEDYVASVNQEVDKFFY